jgi:Lrp/AsnC family transcriptional regulator of lysine biosynthesis
MDEVDRKILKILRDNARITYVDIGRTVGLSEGAVRNRVQTLVDSGVIKRFTIDVATSIGVRALTMISINPSTPTSNVSKAVKGIPDVEIIYEITGGYDIVAVVSSPNIEGINHCIESIRGIDGVVGTNTMIVLRTL